jgi:CRISPR-associated protein Csm2
MGQFEREVIKMYDRDRRDRGYEERRGGGYREERKDSEIKEVIQKINSLQSLNQLDGKEIAKEGGYADQVAKSLKDLKTTQLRKLFGEIKENERKLNEKNWKDIEADFYMIRPSLAYAKARRLVPYDFFKLMSVCMSKVDSGSDEQKKENYRRFVQFLEAIVAYHKYYEG